MPDGVIGEFDVFHCIITNWHTHLYCAVRTGNMAISVTESEVRAWPGMSVPGRLVDNIRDRAAHRLWQKLPPQPMVSALAIMRS